MVKLLSASEIAELDLPGVPKTRAGVRTFAERNGWYFEEATGVGGTRRVYRVPTKYLGHENTSSDDPSASSGKEKAPVAGTVAAGSARVDLRKLDAAIEALARWEATRNVKVPDDRRSAVIAILYDILVADESISEDRMATVFRAVG